MAHHPRTGPGTVTLWIPSPGIPLTPLLARNSGERALGAALEEFRPMSFRYWLRDRITKRSPPSPVIKGSLTPNTALEAMAASTAVPPFARICAPAAEARVWLVATIPFWLMTFDRQ